MYQVIHNKKIKYEHEDLLLAYSFIDSSAKIFDFQLYYNNLISSYKYINEFTSILFNKLSEINEQLNNIYINFNENNINNINVLFPFEHEKMYLVLNQEKFLSNINFILQTYNSEYKIQKSKENIIIILKQYFLNNINEFLNITNSLIENNLYLTYTWQKNLNLDNIIINNDSIKYSEFFNKNEIYHKIEAGIIYSANEKNVLLDYISDIDNIINIILDNTNFLNKLNISQELKQILTKG